VYFVHNCLHFLQLYSFKYATYKPSHRSHTIIPLSNHHTKIIPKSHNLRNIYISFRFCVQPRHWELGHKKVTTMYGMFWLASAFNHDISSWTGTAATTAQSFMFFDATAFQAKFSCDDAITGPASSCDTIKSDWVAPSPPPSPPSPPPSPSPPPPPPSPPSSASALTKVSAAASAVFLAFLAFWRTRNTNHRAAAAGKNEKSEKEEKHFVDEAAVSV